MPHWKIVLAHTKDKHPQLVDATSIGIRVERDGKHYQDFTVTASGPQLRLDHKEIAARADFWDAAAIVGAIQVREQLPTFAPLDDPTMSVDLPLDFGMVDEVSQSREVGSIAEGTTLDDWTQ